MKPSKVPELPWSELACDIFDFERQQYIVTIDYYSKFIEVDKLPDMSTAAVVDALKAQFCRHGIPEKMRTDNGPQYSSSEFNNFCKDYEIQHITSSPYHPQSNGEAERAVQTVKRLWKKCPDRHMALLDYRTTPLASCNLSPAQLLMGRRPRNKLPTSKSLLQPKLYSNPEVKHRFNDDKTRQQYYYDKKAGRNLPALISGDPVRMAPLPGSNRWLPATVVDHHSTPRSYVVQHNGRKYRRNRRDLRLATHEANKPLHRTPADSDHVTLPVTTPVGIQANTPAAKPSEGHSTPPKSMPRPPEPTTETSIATPPTYVTRSGRLSKPPKRLELEILDARWQ